MSPYITSLNDRRVCWWFQAVFLPFQYAPLVLEVIRTFSKTLPFINDISALWMRDEAEMNHRTGKVNQNHTLAVTHKPFHFASGKSATWLWKDKLTFHLLLSAAYKAHLFRRPIIVVTSSTYFSKDSERTRQFIFLKLNTKSGNWFKNLFCSNLTKIKILKICRLEKSTILSFIFNMK